MNRHLATMFFVLALAVCASCGSARPRLAAGGPDTPYSTEMQEIQGILIEARCYFNTGATGGQHSLCAFRSAKANLPIGILTSDGEFIFITETPNEYAGYVARSVSVKGYLTHNRQLIQPVSISLASRGSSR